LTLILTLRRGLRKGGAIIKLKARALMPLVVPVTLKGTAQIPLQPLPFLILFFIFLIVFYSIYL